MQITKVTQDLLVNFTRINPSVLINPGNVISTISPAKNILARAEVSEKFDHQICIYDLSQFLSIAKQSIFEGAEYNFYEKYVDIKKEDWSVTYNYASPSTIIVPPNKLPDMPEADIQVRIEEDTLKNVLNMSNILHKDDISINSDGDKINISVIDKSDSSSNSYSSFLGDGNGSVFNMFFKKESLMILPGTYDVSLSGKFISHFEHDDGDLQYWIALEQDSEYSEPVSDDTPPWDEE